VYFGIDYNGNAVVKSVNLSNNGYITNLPFDYIVEVLSVVSGNGIHGLGIGDLLRGIVSL